jgi:signal peptidase I
MKLLAINLTLIAIVLVSLVVVSGREAADGFSQENISPQDHIKESQIKAYEDGFYVNQENLRYVSLMDTNSMDPLFDKGANLIEKIPQTKEDIELGDIISFSTTKRPYGIVHRVIKIGNDCDGWYVITKGDNNATDDGEKIRFNQIKGIVVAIIY